MKRGVPTMPSEIDPPLEGTLTMKDLFIFSSIASVLKSSATENRVKTIHSLLEKESKTELISDFEGNLRLLIPHYLEHIEETSYSLLLLVSERGMAGRLDYSERTN